MKTVSKKILCLLMVVFLLAAAIPFQAFAAEVTDPDGQSTTETPETPEDPTETPTGGEPAKHNVHFEVYNGSQMLDSYDFLREEGSVIESGEKAVNYFYKCENPTGYRILSYTDGNGETVSFPLTVKSGMTVKVAIEYNSTTFTLTLDANGGSLGNNTTASRTVSYGSVVGSLDTPTRSGWTFLGWFTEKSGGTRIESGTVYNYKQDMTVYAHWSQDTSRLDVKRVLNSTMSGATTIYEQNVAKSERVLDYLNANVKSAAQSSVPAGYSWDGLWRDYALNVLTAQDTTMSQSQTIYVNYTANKYTIYFNVDGGKVNPTSKEVTFDQKVGELPTPTKDKKVFMGWFDEAGNQYTKDTIYKVAGNTTLYAKWQDEAFVLLRIYINGETSSVDRIIDMTKYVENDNVTRDAVEKIIKKYYSAQSGKSLSLAGLFTDSTWADYVKDTSKRGTPTVQIKKDSPTYVYVMVKNAKQGGSTSSTTTPTTKPVDSSNPKTGDTMLIYPAVTVMVLAAAALVTMQVVRKKKQF